MSRTRNTVMNLGVAAAFAGTTFLAGYGATSAHPSHAAMKTLRLPWIGGTGAVQLVKTLDPSRVTSAVAADVIMLGNAGLVRITPEDKVATDLATYKISANRKVYTFTIRSNARFNDGHAVTAADAVFSIERSLSKAAASPVSYYLTPFIVGADAFNTGKASSISGIKATGKRTLTIKILKPWPFFLKALAYPTADVLEKSKMASHPSVAANNYLTNNCDGNFGAGPFKFVCQGASFFRSGATPSYTLTPNKYYYGHKPKIKIYLPAFAQGDVAYNQYLAGQFDESGIPAAHLLEWAKNPRGQYHVNATSIVYYFTPDLTTAPFSDLHCRLAVAYGLDRATIDNKILHGALHPIYSIVPPGFLSFNKGSKNPHYNLKRAKSELSKCSYKSMAVVYKTTQASAASEATNAAIASMMTRVGFKWTNQTITANEYYGLAAEPLNKSNTQILANGWQQDYPDPQDYVTTLMRSDASYNIGGFKSAKFDRLVDKADLEGNKAKRAALYVQAQNIAIQAGAWITDSYALAHRLIKPYVHGLYGTPAYDVPLPKNYDWSTVTINK